MKENIHPKYMECKVTCGCGNTFMTRSTKSELHVELCHVCHPFYSGKQKFIDTAGRVEKFQKRHAWDNSTMGKVLEKEPAKKLPKKLEKVTVGLPKLKKRKPGEGEDLEEEAAPPAGKGRRVGGKGGPREAKEGAPAEAASKPAAPKEKQERPVKPAKAAAAEGAAPEAKG